jgi:hypothetical protein
MRLVIFLMTPFVSLALCGQDYGGFGYGSSNIIDFNNQLEIDLAKHLVNIELLKSDSVSKPVYGVLTTEQLNAFRFIETYRCKKAVKPLIEHAGRDFGYYISNQLYSEPLADNALLAIGLPVIDQTFDLIQNGQLKFANQKILDIGMVMRKILSREELLFRAKARGLEDHPQMLLILGNGK